MLGPVELLDAAGHAVGIPSSRERTLLAALASRPGQVTSTDALIEMIWGGNAPASAEHAVHVHVSSLRKLLGGSPSALVTRRPGYMLQLQSGQLDAERFEDLATRGRAVLATGDATRALSLLREALALWRGPAFADVEWERFAEPEVRRLEEMRLAAAEDQIERSHEVAGILPCRRGDVCPGAGPRPARRNPRQWWWPWRPRVSTGVAPGRVHCGTGRLVGPQVATPSASERQYQQIGEPCPPTGESA